MWKDYEKVFLEKTKDTIPPGTAYDTPITVLVADDDPISRRILSQSLHQVGYHVVIAHDGDEARQILTGDHPPDIALLDWVMPGTTGVELCKVIRDEVSQFIYTVLVTAKTKIEDIVEGLESGAHEFLSKPINVAEFNVRISAAVRLLSYERELFQKNADIAQYAKMMEELANTRAKQLVHAERLATLGMLSAGVGHEIKNPIAYVSGNIQILQKYQYDILSAVQHSLNSNEGNRKKLEMIQENFAEILNSASEGLSSIITIVNGLSKFAHRGDTGRQEYHIENCIDEALELSRNKWKYHVAVHKDCDKLNPISVNAQEITQVVVNLLVNASDAMSGRVDADDNIVDISLKPNGQFQRIVVADNGPGVPEEYKELIWNPFFTTKEAVDGTGLGLAICSGIVEEHGGEIFQKNLPSGGACFVVDLPIEEKHPTLDRN